MIYQLQNFQIFDLSCLLSTSYPAHSCVLHSRGSLLSSISEYLSFIAFGLEGKLSTVVPLTRGFAFFGFAWLWSTMFWKCQSLEINRSYASNSMLLWVAWRTLAMSHLGHDSSLCLLSPCCRCCLISLTFVSQCLCPCHSLLNNSPKLQEWWCWQSRYAREVLKCSFRQKMSILRRCTRSFISWHTKLITTIRWPTKKYIFYWSDKK